jgi:hypothetical protein
MVAKVARTGDDRISLSDSDSGAMAAHMQVAVGHTLRVAVNIVEQAGG